MMRQASLGNTSINRHPRRRASAPLFSPEIFTSLKVNTFIDPAYEWIVKLVLGGVIGAAGKILLDRFSGRTKSIETLLKELKEEKRLSEYSRRRLRRESEAALVDWKMQEKVSPETGRKLKEFPAHDDILVAREFARIGKDTPCPSGRPEDFSTPFFFHLDQDNNFAKELAQQFERLVAKSPTSAELIQHRSRSQAGKINVWVLAPNFKFRRKEEVLDLFYKVATEVRSWLPGARVALEIYLPDEIETLGKIKFLRRSSGDTDDSQDLNPTARYVRARNLAQALFSKGCILGKLRMPDRYRIPAVFLRNRYFASLADLVVNLYSWNTVEISGPPGSGKTELANLLAFDLQTRQQMIVLVASTPQLLKQLEIFLVYQTRSEAFDELANTIRSSPVTSLLVPKEFLTTVEEREAFGDALADAFHSKRYPIAILVDDLQAYYRLNLTLVELSLEGKDLGIRFILVGRKVDTPSDQEQASVIKISCSLLTLLEAKQLLSEWAPNKSQQELDDALQRDWPEKEDDFSLYLLRILVKYLNVLNEAPRDLYENEIKNIVSPVGETLGIQRQIDTDRLHNIMRVLKADKSSEELLNDVRDCLVSETENNLVDPIRLFGTISWFSRFGERDYITVENLKKWGRAFALNDQSATSLLQAAIRAQIFDGDESDWTTWHDPLVADGCAALYLGSEVGTLDHESIAAMIECLNDSESIDILRLALNREVLRKIILAVAIVRPDLVGVVNRLLSSEFIARLAERPGYVSELGEALFHHGNKLSVSNLKPVALAISKILPLSSDLNNFCWTSVGKSSADATLALAAKAAEWDGDYGYFLEAQKYNNEPYMNRVAADMAARQWGEQGGEPLSQRLIELDLSEYDLRRIWSLWCSKKPGETLSAMIEKFLQDADTYSENEIANGVLAATALEEILLNRSPAERKQYLQIERWGDITKHLALRGKVLAAARMVKWIAFAYGPELVSRESKWVITSDRVSAITVESNSPANVQEVFRQIRAIVDKSGKVRFSLPSSLELSQISGSREESVELVRDKLGENFQYSVEVDRKWLVVSKGSKQETITTEQFFSQKFAWRPRLRIDSLS